MELKKYTRLSLLLALSVVLNLIESIIPIFNGTIPGFKLGLANTITLFVMYEYSFKDALYVSIVRVFLVGILRTGVFSVAFFFSLGGAIASTIVMAFSKKFLPFSIIGTSIMGSIFHSTGQIIVAIFITNMTNMLYLLPWLIIFSIPTGIVTGVITKELMKYFEKN